MTKKLTFAILATIFYLSALCAETPEDRAVKASIEILEGANPAIAITWSPDTNAVEYVIKRKTPKEDSWSEPIAELGGEINEFTDYSVIKGIGYEYFIKKKSVVPTDTSNYIYDGYGYVYAGYEVETPDYKGEALLLIDETIADELKNEIKLFCIDIIGDGWTLTKRKVPRTEEFDPKTVKNVKDTIVEVYNRSGGELKTVILLGRIAVPYSGDIAVDGHIDHGGAWAADTYYADINGEWTDAYVLDTNATREANHNEPGDGKFDQIQIASDLELQLGRIDFYEVNYFGLSELELLRRYLNKNREYKTNERKPLLKGVIDDNMGIAFSEAFASGAWMSFTAALGRENVESGEFVIDTNEPDNIFAYGCGAGSYQQVGAVISLSDFEDGKAAGVFTGLFGSYSGDWDSENNILRATLASDSPALTCVWFGRPYWHFHHLALDKTIGYCAKVSQNNQYLYESSGLYGYRYVHASLLGDPTLRLYHEPAPKNLQAVAEIGLNSKEIRLFWSDSSDETLGFNVYRAASYFEKFEKLNDEPLAEPIFIDKNPKPGRNLYMIRSKRRKQTLAGSILNYSQGAFTEVDIPELKYASELEYSLKLYPNPAENEVKISLVVKNEEFGELTVWNVKGGKVKTLLRENLHPRLYELDWNLLDHRKEKVSSGIYYLRYRSRNKNLLVKLSVIR